MSSDNEEYSWQILIQVIEDLLLINQKRSLCIYRKTLLDK